MPTKPTTIKRATTKATVRVIDVNAAALVRHIPEADGFPAANVMSMAVPEGGWNLETRSDNPNEAWRLMGRAPGGSLVIPSYPGNVNSQLYRLVEVPA